MDKMNGCFKSSATKGSNVQTDKWTNDGHVQCRTLKRTLPLYPGSGRTGHPPLGGVHLSGGMFASAKRCEVQKRNNKNGVQTSKNNERIHVSTNV